MKECPVCKLMLDISNFSKDRTKKDGHNYHCKSCHKKYRREHYVKNIEKYRDKAKNFKYQERREFIRFKKTLSCVFCQESHYKCLDFHHLRNKQQNIATMVSAYNILTVFKEIKKCICICANCHRKIHDKVINVESDENKKQIEEWQNWLSQHISDFNTGYKDRISEYRKTRTLRHDIQQELDYQI